VTWRLVFGRGGYHEVTMTAIKKILPFHHLLHFCDRVRCTHNSMRILAGVRWVEDGGEPGFAARGTVIQKRVVTVEVFRPPFPASVPVCMCVLLCVCACAHAYGRRGQSLSLSPPPPPTPAPCPPQPLSRSRAGRMTAGVHGCVDYDRHSHTCTGAWRGADWDLFTRETKGREL
jgi:hypothetical protein